MRHFRLTLVALVGWLFLFYNIERIHEPLNIASFVYVLSAAGAVLLLLKRGERRTLAWSTLAVSLVLLMLLKAQWGYPIVGRALPITVTEAAALGLTFALASRLGEDVQRFEEGAFALSQAHENDDFDAEQSAMYGEVRRARQYQRPLALAFIRSDTAEVREALHPLIEQSQREAARRLAQAKIGQLIGAQLRECDLVARRDDGYVILMPEATELEADETLRRVRQALGEQFSLSLPSGVATLPREEVTFTGLLERAAAATHFCESGGPAVEAPVEGASDGPYHPGVEADAV